VGKKAAGVPSPAAQRNNGSAGFEAYSLDVRRFGATGDFRTRPRAA